MIADIVANIDVSALEEIYGVVGGKAVVVVIVVSVKKN